MFASLLKAFAAPENTAQLNDSDARLALTALLVRVARTDGVYAEAEIARINSVISRRYALDSAQADALRAESELLEAQAPDTVRFTRTIKDAVPYEDRTAVIEALWEVALADGAREDEENALLRLVAQLLGVKDRDSAHARQRAAQSS